VKRVVAALLVGPPIVLAIAVLFIYLIKFIIKIAEVHR